MSSFFTSGTGRRQVQSSLGDHFTYKPKNLDPDAQPRNSAIVSSSSNSSSSSINFNIGTSSKQLYEIEEDSTGFKIPKRNKDHVSAKSRRGEQDSTAKNIYDTTDDKISSSSNSAIAPSPQQPAGNKRSRRRSSLYEDMDTDDDDFQGVLPSSGSKKERQLMKPNKGHLEQTKATIDKAKAKMNPAAPPQSLLIFNKTRRPAAFPTRSNLEPVVKGLDGIIVPEGTDEESDFIKPKAELFKPIIKKFRVNNNPDNEEHNKVLSKFDEILKQEKEDEDKERCPYCSQILDPLPHTVRKALKEIRRKDEAYEKKQSLLFKKENSRSTSSYSIPLSLRSKRSVDVEEKDTFCTLHRMECEVKPEGIKKGYPVKIEFGRIYNRIKRFSEELDKIIKNEITSHYRKIAEDAYKEEGVMKARSAMSVLNRFETSLPGYYGPKGATVILNALVEMYLKTGYLKEHLVSPQLPLEFLQQVLVPEAGVKLIRSDLFIKFGPIPNMSKRAKEMMEESRDYGSAMFPADEHEIESYDVDKPLTFHLSSDDDNEEEDSYYS